MRRRYAAMKFDLIGMALLAAAGHGESGGGGLAEQFGVNWSNLFAQIVVFLAVFFILKRFAFGPILAQLEERKERIREQQENAEKIRRELAEAEETRRRLVAEANERATKIVSEAETSASALTERRTQEAVAQAEALIAKARDAAARDRDQMMGELRREVGRLVVQTTAKVAGKVLTPEDQRRLQEEAAREMAV